MRRKSLEVFGKRSDLGMINQVTIVWYAFNYHLEFWLCLEDGHEDTWHVVVCSDQHR